MYRHVLIVLFAAGLAISSGACMGAIRMEQTLPTAVADLTAVKAVSLVDSNGQVLLSGTFSEPSNSGGKTQRTADLMRTNDKTRAGSADIAIDRSNGVTEEEIVLKADDLPYPASCRVMVDGQEVATFSTMEDGKLDMRVWRRVTAGSAR